MYNYYFFPLPPGEGQGEGPPIPFLLPSPNPLPEGEGFAVLTCVRMTKPILTIDLDAVAVNWRALDALSGTAETAAAVKADGYGCGAVQIATALQAAGCKTFFVAPLEEGAALRGASPRSSIS